MKTVSLEELLEAGCHFGHQVSRQNPKARDFIFEARDNIHIIDLEKTKEGLEEAGVFVRDLGKKGGTMLVLGTKRQAEGILAEEAKRAKDAEVDGLYFVTKRWIGGTLTNLQEVSKNFQKLKNITALLKNDYERSRYTKKELGDFEKERQKLESFYGGIVDMTKAPDAVFIIDTHLERVSVDESRKMGVTTLGITDTNADPTVIDYPIPANDDAVGSLKLIISYIFDAWSEGRKNMGKEEKKQEKGAEESKGTKEPEVKKTEKNEKESVKKEEKPKTVTKKATVKKETKKAAEKKKEKK